MIDNLNSVDPEVSLKPLQDLRAGIKEFFDELEQRFSKLEKRIEIVSDENSNLRERVFDLERSDPDFVDPADYNRPDAEDEQ